MNCFGILFRKMRERLPLWFHDVAQSCFPSLVHALNLIYITSLQKQVTNVSLVLKDSDMEFVELAFCIKWPEYREFKNCIIYLAYMYYNGPDQLECPIFEIAEKVIDIKST